LHVLLCSLLLCLQLEQMQQLRMQIDTLHSSAAAAAAMMCSQSDAMALRTHSEAMLRSQSEVLALRTHSEQVSGNSHGHQQQQQQQAMAMGLARLQAHMQQAQAAAAQQQAAQEQLPMQNIQQQQPNHHHQQQQQQHDEDELLPPIAEDGVGSAFMLQHPMDAVELALHEAHQRAGTSAQQQQQQHAAQELMGLSGVAGAAAVGQMVYGGAAASDVDGSSAEMSRGAVVGKRGRPAGEVHAVADPDTQGVLFMTASEWGPQAEGVGVVYVFC
jgi:hypothetical protein